MLKKLFAISKQLLKAGIVLFMIALSVTAFFSWKYYATVLKEEDKVKVIIATNNGGQLCNQLWQFAYLAAFCKEQNYELYNPAFFRYAKHFEYFYDDLMISPTNSCKVLLPSIKEVQRRSHRIITSLLKKNTFDKRVISSENNTIFLPPTPGDFPSLANGDYFFFDWYFDNPVGLEKHKAYLKEIFKPKKSYVRNIDLFWKEIDRSRLTVGVHIRHGDYRVWRGGKYFFSIEQINKALSEISVRYSEFKPQFIIYCDEKRVPEEFPDFDVVIGTGDFIEDLYSLARCDLIVGVGVSTYNEWAAWYGEVPRVKLEEETDWAALDYEVTHKLTQKHG